MKELTKLKINEIKKEINFDEKLDKEYLENDTFLLEKKVINNNEILIASDNTIFIQFKRPVLIEKNSIKKQILDLISTLKNNEIQEISIPNNILKNSMIGNTENILYKTEDIINILKENLEYIESTYNNYKEIVLNIQEWFDTIAKIWKYIVEERKIHFATTNDQFMEYVNNLYNDITNNQSFLNNDSIYSKYSFIESRNRKMSKLFNTIK